MLRSIQLGTESTKVFILMEYDITLTGIYIATKQIISIKKKKNNHRILFVHKKNEEKKIETMRYAIHLLKSINRHRKLGKCENLIIENVCNQFILSAENLLQVANGGFSVCLASMARMLTFKL